MKAFALLLVSLFLSGTAVAQDNWRDVEDVLRTTGKMVDSKTMKIAIPRSDQTVMKGDTKIAPEFGLTSEIKFTGRSEKAMMSAELVLLEKEVQPVMTQLQAQGFEITALHNHFIGTDPAVYFLHVAGSGTAKGLANGLKTALSQTGMQLGAQEAAAPSSASTQWSSLQTALGRKGEQKGDVLAVEVPRKDKVTVKGAAVPPSFGAVHHLLFQKAGDKVTATGELVLLDKEVNQVAKLLKSNRFDVTALHNHHLYDNPRLFYLHFWATDTPDALARTLRRALDMTSAAASAPSATTAPATTPSTSRGTSGAGGTTTAPGTGTTTTAPSGSRSTPSTGAGGTTTSPTTTAPGTTTAPTTTAPTTTAPTTTAPTTTAPTTTAPTTTAPTTTAPTTTAPATTTSPSTGTTPAAPATTTPRR